MNSPAKLNTSNGGNKKTFKNSRVMEYTSVSDILVNREGNNRSEGVTLANDIQNILSHFWNSISCNFVLKSDVEALVQDAVNVIKNKIEDEKEMLTISEAAEYLQISKGSVYKMTSSRQIPFYKLAGKMIYIHRQDLVDWIKKYPYKSKQQIEAEATAFCMRRKQQSNVGDTRIRTTVVDSDVKSRNKQLAMEIRQKYQLR